MCARAMYAWRVGGRDGCQATKNRKVSVKVSDEECGIIKKAVSTDVTGTRELKTKNNATRYGRRGRTENSRCLTI